MAKKKGARHRLVGRPRQELSSTEPAAGRRRGRHRVVRPAAGGMLAVGAALVAASTASSSVPTALPTVPAVGASEPVEAPASSSLGVGGNTPPRAAWPMRVRTDDRFVHAAPGAQGTVGIPATVLAAYQRAAERTSLVQPGCRLPLELLAAIGKVESGHARGGRVTAEGRTLDPILGPVLDGAGPFAAIADTDGGELDGNAVWDRAMGPMQFIPGTWARWQADGNADGQADPHNVFDASLAAARYLCAANRDLGTPDGLDAAILSYNHSVSYLALVRSWMLVYQNGAVSVADITGGDPAMLALAAADWDPTAPPSAPSSAPPSAEAPAEPPATRPPGATPPPPVVNPPTQTPPAETPPSETPPPEPAPETPPGETPPPETPPEEPPETPPETPPEEPPSAETPPEEPPQEPSGSLVGGVCQLLGGLLNPLLPGEDPDESC
ncbi:lytic transglycosylase domain-containing protein [Actinophytocola xanthii]|uniref:lytic transglycosylase domain-containing protein n=1 Tax=Actinophytocola xanthii TaxID=1912961 RepID=UPI0018E90B98|nr:lytic transglycosylase domain-containing protein [Actinophytocola xanthii]